MSKKNKNKHIQSSPESGAETPSILEEYTEASQDVAELTEPQEDLIPLEDYAFLNVVNYNRNHWPSIAAYAKSLGWRSLDNTPEACANLLRRYGVKLK